MRRYYHRKNPLVGLIAIIIFLFIWKIIAHPEILSRLMGYGLLFLFIYIGWKIYAKQTKKEPSREFTSEELEEIKNKYIAQGILPSVNEKVNTPLPYKRKEHFLSVAETRFYEVLNKIAEENNFVVQCKVRLEALVRVPFYTKNRYGLRNRIKSREMNFVLCSKQNMKPLLIIELDDSSHQREDRIERDDFIDKALHDAGLPILHIKAQQNYDSNVLVTQILELIL